jgi:hypothetical protein
MSSAGPCPDLPQFRGHVRYLGAKRTRCAQSEISGCAVSSTYESMKRSGTQFFTSADASSSLTDKPSVLGFRDAIKLPHVALQSFAVLHYDGSAPTGNEVLSLKRMQRERDACSANGQHDG